jgi:cell division transport system ATP-binding protein
LRLALRRGSGRRGGEGPRSGARGAAGEGRAPAPARDVHAVARREGAISLYHVSKAYQAGSFALRDVSLEVAKGEFVFLTGPSGAGKTTLMRLVFAAERPSEGQLVVLGRNLARLRAAAVPALRRRIGVVFQDFKLLPRLTVEENVMLTLHVLGTPRRAARARAFAILKQLGLQHRRAARPLSLSGGEQQRVAIARALVNEPEILLADEPTGNLDPELKLEIMDLIASASTRGTTVLVASHELELVERYGRRIVRLEEGRVREDSRAAAATLY